MNPDDPRTDPRDSPCVGCARASVCTEPCPEYNAWFDEAAYCFNKGKVRE